MLNLNHPILLLLVFFTEADSTNWPSTCEELPVDYEYNHVEGSSFVVVGTAGVRATDDENADNCLESYTCIGIIRRETFYYGAEKFHENTKQTISTLFIDHCYAEFYMQRVLSKIFHTDKHVTLYDQNCTKHNISTDRFRIFLSDMSSAITNIVAPFSRLLHAPQLAYGGASNWFDDEVKYPLLLRLTSSNRHEANFIIQICKRLRVDKIALVYAETADGLSGAQKLREDAEKECICIKQKHKITRNISQDTIDEISNDLRQDSTLKVVVWMGDESYIGKLLDHLPPKLFISGLSLLTELYPASVRSMNDSGKCMTNGTEEAFTKKLNYIYKRVNGTLAVTAPMTTNSINSDICNRLSTSKNICLENQVVKRDRFTFTMLKAWKAIWKTVNHDHTITAPDRYNDFYKALKLASDIYPNHATADYDLYRISCDKDEPTLDLLKEVSMRGGKISPASGCYTFGLSSCVDWINDTEMCTELPQCDKSDQLYEMIIAYGIAAAAACLLFISVCILVLTCFMICTHQPSRQRTRKSLSEKENDAEPRYTNDFIDSTSRADSGVESYMENSHPADQARLYQQLGSELRYRSTRHSQDGNSSAGSSRKSSRSSVDTVRAADVVSRATSQSVTRPPEEESDQISAVLNGVVSGEAIEMQMMQSSGLTLSVADLATYEPTPPRSLSTSPRLDRVQIGERARKDSVNINIEADT